LCAVILFPKGLEIRRPLIVCAPSEA
jgi:hypothetical protein